MDDCRLKPSMLRSVVRDLPDENRPFLSWAELAAVLSLVRTHGLLSERLPDNSERKLVEAWREAVDGWVERVVSLASSKVPDKCWTGICLLGVTCEECCFDRFQSSYAIWFQKLMENIQSPSCTYIIKVACYSSLADLFRRLACFPNLKKDGTSFAGKIIQPLLQMLNEDAGETFWEVATTLLCTLISFFPSSIQRHYDNVEAVLTSKIMAAKCNLNASKKIACILALLPKVKGDEDSWCLMIQKILIAINLILTDAFQGLEEEKKSSEIMKMLVPPGKDPPPPLGGQTSGEASEPATKRLHDLLVPRVTALMHSCCNMLTNPYPSPVSIHVPSLLATVGRVLQVDGSFRGSLFPLFTSMHQELLCAELPSLHLCSLDLLIAIIKGLQSKLVSHGANVVRLLTEYFRIDMMPSIRTKVYSVVHMLLISMSVGMTLYLAQKLINIAFADLTDDLGIESSAMLSNMLSSTVVGRTFQKEYVRKRKRDSEIPVGCPNGFDLIIKPCCKKAQAPLSVKIAALKALEALLTVGSSRPVVDCLVVAVATDACDARWANEDNMSMMNDSSSFADFQLATLEVLLASLLSPTQTRPPHLSRGLHLFRRGRQETGSKIATFCAHALLALAVLIHPRSLPLDDHPPKDPSLEEGFNQRFAGNTFNSGIEAYLPSFSKGDLALLDEEDEDLLNGEQNFVEGINLNDKHTQTTKQTEKPSAINVEACHDVLVCESYFPQNVDVEMVHLDRDKVEESRHKNDTSSYSFSENKMDFGQGSSVIHAMEMTLGKSLSPLHFSANLSNHGSDAPNLSADTSKKDAAPKILSDLNNGKDVMLSYDSDTGSQDSLPDIVDADPDTE